MKRTHRNRLTKRNAGRRLTPARIGVLQRLFESALAKTNGPGSVLHEILDALAKVAVIGTVIYAILEYNSAVSEKQSVFSFEIIEEWENDHYRESYKKVTSHINEIRDSLPAEYRNAKNYRQLETNYVGTKLLEILSDDPKLEDNVRQLFYFYSKTGICGLEGICDKELLQAFFKAGAQDFLAYLHPYSRLVRQSGQTNFGHYAERFFLN